MIERPRQLPLSDDFSREAVQLFARENPTAPFAFVNTSLRTAHIIENPKSYTPHQVEGARAFFNHFFGPTK